MCSLSVGKPKGEFGEEDRCELGKHFKHVLNTQGHSGLRDQLVWKHGRTKGDMVLYGPQNRLYIPMPHLSRCHRSSGFCTYGRAQPVSVGTKSSFDAASLRLGMCLDGQMEG